jgi:hypothetical protein
MVYLFLGISRPFLSVQTSRGESFAERIFFAKTFSEWIQQMVENGVIKLTAIAAD